MTGTARRGSTGRRFQRPTDHAPVDVHISRYGDRWIVDVYRAGAVTPVEDLVVSSPELGQQWAQARYRHLIQTIEVHR